MPLKHGKSEKAFKSNVKAEMHAGKPQKQALAIAYSVKRRAKKAKGGGVHREDTPMGKGVSAAGYHARSAKEMADKYGATDSAPLNVAKQAHREKLAELKAMPKVPKYAKGGDVKDESNDMTHHVELRNDKHHVITKDRHGNKYDTGRSFKTLQDAHSFISKDKASIKKPRLAEGGEISAKDEKRPNPNDLYNDAKQAHQSEARKPLKNSDWTDNPTVKQAQDNNGRKVMPISRPKMVPTNAFSTKLYNQEGQLEDSMPPSSPKDQPESDYNEMGAKRQGPKVPDMARQHNNGKAPYKEEIEDQYSQDEAESDMKQMAEGGDVTRGQELDKGLKGEINKLISFSQAEEDGLEHPAHEEEDNDQMRPDMKEYMSGRMPAYADGGILGDAEDTLDPSVPLGKMAGIKLADGGILGDAEDTLDPSVPLGKMAGIKLAKGGLAYEEDMQPQDEEEMEHHDSIAAAIMAKRDRLHAHIDSGAMDEDHAAEDEDSSFPSEDHPELDQDMYALGGEINEDGDSILSKDSIYPSRSSQADLSRNHDEDANMEDQTSFNALRKENYNSSNLDKDQPEDSNMKGDEREAARSDKHDMIAKIRAKRSKRQFNWE